MTRGVWLIFLELVVVRCLGLQFNFDYRTTILEVIWALGWAMIALAGFVWLPRVAIAAVSLAMIVGHNLLDGVRSTNPWWVFLHRPGFLIPPPGHVVFVAYPIVPWIGVTAIGFVLGGDLRLGAGATTSVPAAPRASRSRARSSCCGSSTSTAIRSAGRCSRPRRTRSSRSSTSTKYPPSLLFLLMTLGFTMLGLYAFDAGVPQLG